MGGQALAAGVSSPDALSRMGGQALAADVSSPDALSRMGGQALAADVLTRGWRHAAHECFFLLGWR
jgi:hypothetical protein